MTTQFSAAAEKISAVATLLLGWSPDQFWTATPQELIATMTLLQQRNGNSHDPLDRAQLQKLRGQFPDG